MRNYVLHAEPPVTAASTYRSHAITRAAVEATIISFLRAVNADG